MTTRAEAFEAWLRANGSPDEIAAFSPSIAAGILSVAGSAPVTAEHVASAVQLARDAGIDTSAMVRLGERLVEFEAVPSAPQPSTVSVAFTRRASAPAPSPVAPELPTIRIATPAATAKQKPPAVSRSPRSRAIGIGVAVVAIVALAWFARPGSAPESEVTRIAALDLAIRFPPGWQLADRAPTPTPHSKAVLVERGDRQAFVAVLPLATADPLVAIRQAEAGASAQLGAGHAVYYSESCSALGPRAATCRGTATDGGASRVVVTHLRIGTHRVVVALFVSPSAMDAEADAIAASAEP